MSRFLEHYFRVVNALDFSHPCLRSMRDPEHQKAWLGETPAPPDALQALLRPFPAERMTAHMIGPAIGNVKNDDAALIERLISA